MIRHPVSGIISGLVIAMVLWGLLALFIWLWIG
jgi:hypothetical protein